MKTFRLFLILSFLFVALSYTTFSFANTPASKNSTSPNPTATSSSKVIDKILVIVNDEIITLSDLDAYLKSLEPGGLNDGILLPDLKSREDVRNNPNRLLEVLVDEALLESRFKSEKINISQEEVDRKIREITKRNQMSQDDLKKFLANSNIAWKAYYDFTKKGLQKEELIQKYVTSQIKISEQEILNRYVQTRPDQGQKNIYEWTLAHAVFLKEKSGAQAALTKAKNFLKRFQTVQNFELLAGEMSEDENFENGGLLGTFKSGEMSNEIESQIRDLNQGQITGIIENKDAFRIIKVLNKKLIPDPDYENEKGKIFQQLQQQAFSSQLKAWLKELKQSAYIHYNTQPEELKNLLRTIYPKNNKIQQAQEDSALIKYDSASEPNSLKKNLPKKKTESAGAKKVSKKNEPGKQTNKAPKADHK